MVYDAPTKAISLTVREYDYKSTWIVLDTTDNGIPPMLPYIDTTLLCTIKKLHRLRLSKQYNDRLARIYTDEFENKLKRLINESENTVLNNLLVVVDSQFENKVNNEVNLRTPLGILFAVLGLIDSTVHFKNSKNSSNFTNFFCTK